MIYVCNEDLTSAIGGRDSFSISLSILTVKNPTRCNSVSKFYYSLF